MLIKKLSLWYGRLFFNQFEINLIKNLKALKRTLENSLIDGANIKSENTKIVFIQMPEDFYFLIKFH